MSRSCRAWRWGGLVSAVAVSATLSLSPVAADDQPAGDKAATATAVEELSGPDGAVVPAAAEAKPDEAGRNVPAVEPAVAAPRPQPAAAAPLSDTEWVIVIRPDYKEAVFASVSEPTPASSAAPAGPVLAAPVMSTPCCGPQRMSYADALAEIGFSRAEYEANPSYRHEAAMELMFGQMRPTTVVKQTVPYFSRYPDTFRLRNAIYPYQFGMGNDTLNLRHFWYQQWYW